MKNKNYTKNIVFPWDIKGYIKLRYSFKCKLIKSLLDKYQTVKNINKCLNFPEYWFNNFKRNEKIHTKDLKKIAQVLSLDIIKNIIQFNDDKGSSSISYLGEFPIKYDPLWHFLFCLSVGDGHIDKNKKRFTWYQKKEGQKELINLLKKHNFDYKSSPKNAKQGMIVPQLVRKLGSFVTKLDSSKLIKQNIVEVSRTLGKDFELALLCAFFMDEAGMSKSKSNSEITLHQEGNLLLLEKIGDLLNKFNVIWSKNKKGDKWCIRINPEGVIQLSNLFNYLRKYNIGLLHREKIFKEKVKMANKTAYKIPLRKEAKSVREYLLNNHRNKIITLNEIRSYFESNFNVSTRSIKLVDTMKKKNEVKSVDLGKYLIRGE